jgi:hypothetical protein
MYKSLLSFFKVCIILGSIGLARFSFAADALNVTIVGFWTGSARYLFCPVHSD